MVSEVTFASDLLPWLLSAEVQQIQTQLGNQVESSFGLTLFFVLLLILAIASLVVAKYTDSAGHIVRQATPLPPSLVMEGERVWVYGKAFTETPVKAPHFERECIWFSYNMNGNFVSQGFPPYLRIQDDQGEVWIECAKAYFLPDFSKELTAKEYGVRHSLYYIPYPCEEIAAIGKVQKRQGKLWLEPEAWRLSLQITPMSRGEILRLFEKSEAIQRGFGVVGVFLGVAGLYYLKVQPFLLPAVGMGLLAALPIWIIQIYNRIVALRVRLESDWRGVDIVLKLRYDLIPNLAALVQTYMEHEKQTFQKIALLREHMISQSLQERVRGENKVQQLWKSLLARVEAYPELQSHKLAQELIKQLRRVEDKIAHAKVVYNEVVTEYNSYIEGIPVCLLAPLFGAKREERFALDREYEQRQKEGEKKRVWERLRRRRAEKGVEGR